MKMKAKPPKRSKYRLLIELDKPDLDDLIAVAEQLRTNRTEAIRRTLRDAARRLKSDE